MAASPPSRTNASRWASFDCYGTLIDWNLGIRTELERLFGVEQAPHLLERYHELEPVIQSEPFRSYREVLALTLERLAQEEQMQLPEGEAGALATSLPDWPPFSEVPAALAELRERGWLLAILSNTDRDLIAASQRRLEVPIDLAVVAEDVQSYKPAHGHWERFFEATTAERETHVHVGASLFHDIAPARELGLRSVWINRLGEKAEPVPDRELLNLSDLPDTLDELVPA
ncbi:MAG: HAD hydrolase-like protein [Actinomycetota bacterium]